MKRHPTFSIALVLLLIQVYSVWPQEIFFNRVFPPEGKIFGIVAGIVQDKSGYMWFATGRGLFRYNGYQMTAFKNNPLDSNSPVSDQLEAMCAEASGILWIGTFDKGLERFDPVTGIFTHFQHDSSNTESLGNNSVRAVLIDHTGTLWIGTGEGLDRYDPESGKFIHYSHRPEDPTSLSCNTVVALYEDRQGVLWIGTGSVYAGKAYEGGLNRLDKKQESLPAICMIPKIHTV